MGRRHHVEKTLLKNIEDNLPRHPDDPAVEFVLLDYNSKDGLKDWVANNAALRPYLDDGTLVYARYPDAEYFRMPHAKNMAHRLATGDVVCNLDADNFTGEGFARYLARAFADGKHAIVHPSFSLQRDLPVEKRGFSGRIALRREDFLALGGYSEARFGKNWGYDDIDFVIRGLAYGLPPQPMFDEEFFQVVPHDDKARVENMQEAASSKKEIKIRHASNVSLRHLRVVFNTFVSRVQANKGMYFGEGKILGINGAARVIRAEKAFVRVSKRGFRALLSLRRDHAMQKPATDNLAGRRTAEI